MRSKVLITGGAGFIGNAVKLKLTNLGCEVLSIGRNKSEDIQVELNDDKVKEIIQAFNPDVVCHFASGSNIARADENRENEFNNVVLATDNIINALSKIKKNKLRIIYLSSQAVYGIPSYLPVDEKHKVCPNTFYGKVKLHVEQKIINSGINHLIFRVSSVFGKEQDYRKSGAIAKFVNKMQSNEPPVIFNSPDVISDFIYIEDLCSAVLQAVSKEDVTCEIFNIGSGVPVKLSQVLNILYNYFPNAPKPIIEVNSLYPSREQRGLYFDIHKAIDRLNWNTKYNIEDGIKGMLVDLSRV